ncbi:hypothetical protein D8674_032477 [Pyrus ussuriensis x Pyrus communis]|uniref:Uncharacterized protein n=1 Tax=Pyrus ussuriensis x Pyrus communis TaxID=2448454 RepID=A0A5N5HNI0_9ROSA|nr:hypothetical protein D8674_032477 [Pyrus ussuriensis x Pyrus communis]
MSAATTATVHHDQPASTAPIDAKNTTMQHRGDEVKEDRIIQPQTSRGSQPEIERIQPPIKRSSWNYHEQHSGLEIETLHSISIDRNKLHWRLTADRIEGA